jgi:hypothetical protein
MKLSTDTIKILRNFSDINNTIYIRKGNTIITVDPQKRIVADASISETLPRDCALYDLNRFLGVTSLFDSPDLDFAKDKIVVKSDNRSIDFIYADPSVVQDAGPTREKIPSVFDDKTIVHKFTLTEADLKSLRQAASLLGLTHVSFVSDDSGLQVVAQDVSNESLGKVTLNVEGECTAKSTCNMLFENLKVLPDTYNVEVTPRVAHFVGTTTGVQYWIVMEAR